MWNVAEAHFQYITAEQALNRTAAQAEREARATRRWRPQRRAPNVRRHPIIATP
ncbi:hypothetical protein JOF56_000661 [Kibdelosporangium banguiense]|uniref:Uncharacterized protein n=1 Tax=Kibdelosporangium banguiense TaxID=1365924 RepID=A0ABS4T8V8_9PSEU|nr:hypothetical protein [Kibdelosporangium banguiense]MBP2320276.1 hypothetical protein [Kibdelosporangium banguiense]